MSTAFPPGPPKVHAPHRLTEDAAPTAAGAPGVPAVDGGPVAQGSSVPGAGQGAVVTASVGGASTPAAPAAPGQPSTVTAVSPPTPQTGLARTGADVALLLVFALAAVLIGVLLVRLGQPRPLRHHTDQGAP